MNTIRCKKRNTAVYLHQVQSIKKQKSTPLRVKLKPRQTKPNVYCNHTSLSDMGPNELCLDNAQAEVRIGRS